MINSKITSYLFYAIGEIILVVIGIMIAINIDNWNERRKNRKKLQVIQTNLRQEFLKNEIMLDSVMQFPAHGKGHGKRIISIINKLIGFRVFFQNKASQKQENFLHPVVIYG